MFCASEIFDLIFHAVLFKNKDFTRHDNLYALRMSVGPSVASAEVYSVGFVLARMLGGRVRFDGHKFMSVGRSVHPSETRFFYDAKVAKIVCLKWIYFPGKIFSVLFSSFFSFFYWSTDDRSIGWSVGRSVGSSVIVKVRRVFVISASRIFSFSVMWSDYILDLLSDPVQEITS